LATPRRHARSRSRRSAGARSRKRPRPDPLPAEREKVEAFVEKIDITDTASVLSYGVGSQRKVSEFSERALTGVRNNDLGEIGDDISSLIVTLKDFDPDKQEKSGPLAIFHKAKNSLEALRTRYTAVEKNVREISDTLEGHQRTLLKDIATLDQLYALNEAYFKELTMYVVAGKEKLEQVRGRRACPAPGQGGADRALPRTPRRRATWPRSATASRSASTTLNSRARWPSRRRRRSAWSRPRTP
jgi:uncharacterized protein YaaN involved in tellurite resistance